MEMMIVEDGDGYGCGGKGDDDNKNSDGECTVYSLCNCPSAFSLQGENCTLASIYPVVLVQQ